MREIMWLLISCSKCIFRLQWPMATCFCSVYTELDSFSDTFLYSLCSLEPRLSCGREPGSETILYAVRIALDFTWLLSYYCNSVTFLHACMLVPLKQVKSEVLYEVNSSMSNDGQQLSYVCAVDSRVYTFLSLQYSFWIWIYTCHVTIQLYFSTPIMTQSWVLK